MGLGTGILFIRAGMGRDQYDPIPEFREMGDSRVALALAAGLTYQDVAVGSVSEAGAKTAAALMDYNLVIHTGHGSERYIVGDYSGPPFIVISLDDADSTDLVDGRAFYSFSCQTGADLMPTLVTPGVSGRTAVATAGYSDNYGFLYSGGGAEDLYMEHTMSPGFKFIESLIEDNTWLQAYTDCYDQFDTEIAYWNASGNPFASTAVSVLEADQSYLVKFGDNTWQLSGDTSPSQGTINVSTNNAGATFSLSGAASYSGSGTSYTNATATPGEYTITYGDVAGFITPPDETKTLVAGASITFTGTYAPVSVSGTINVTTNVSATVTLTGPATYSNTGTSYSNTSALPGLYTCTFGAVSGYSAPAAQTRNLTVGGVITFTGTYVADDAVPEEPTPGTPSVQIDDSPRITTIERTVQEV